MITAMLTMMVMTNEDDNADDDDNDDNDDNDDDDNDADDNDVISNLLFFQFITKVRMKFLTIYL